MSFLSTPRVSKAFAVCIGCWVCGAVLSQEDIQGDAIVESHSTRLDEIIVVRGRTRVALRARFELAEEALYEHFNRINSDDEFDIFCRMETRAGTRILWRRCQPEFARDIEAKIASEIARSFQGIGGVPPGAFYAERAVKVELMTEEIRQLAREDEEFFGSLERLADIYFEMNDGRSQRSLSESLSRQITIDDGDLPFDAGLAFEVLMGRKSWEHALMLQTFAITQVYGTIRSMRLKCDEQSERLTYEVDAEWTIPDSWGACTLIVKSKPETTFSLYEFN